MPLLKASIFLFIALCSLKVYSQTEARPSVINIVTDTWESAAMKDGSGYYLDLMRRIYQPRGIRLNIKFMPYLRAVSDLKAGKADVILGTYQGIFNESWYPRYSTDMDNVDIAMNRDLYQQWQGLSSLKNKRMAAIYGNSYKKAFALDIDIIETNSVDAMIKMLVSKRVDLVADYKFALQKSMKALGTKNILIKESVLTLPLYFVFFDSLSSSHLKNIFDEEMANMVRSGELKAMIIKSLGDEKYYPKSINEPAHDS